jgi:hypothetical protein
MHVYTAKATEVYNVKDPTLTTQVPKYEGTCGLAAPAGLRELLKSV